MKVEEDRKGPLQFLQSCASREDEDLAGKEKMTC